MSSWDVLSVLLASTEEEGKPGQPEGRESCSGPSLGWHSWRSEQGGVRESAHWGWVLRRRGAFGRD